MWRIIPASCRRAWSPVRTLHRAREGLTILEMAFAMPVIVLLIFFIADVGLLFFGYVSASNALREGARCGVVGYTDDAVVARVRDATEVVDASTITVTTTGTDPGDDLTVTGTFEHEWITPLVGGIAPTNFTRSVTMRLETTPNQRPGACGTDGGP